MGKVKLNLVSGAVVEKPLISAFKANNNSYVVLDNEMNGSMGLPIILVCKFENNKLTKIVDQSEWGIVKEYLKNIIAGNQIEFIKVDMEMSADDIYYTQLTLPVPSFDALKNAYKVDEGENSSVVNPVGTTDSVATPITPVDTNTPAPQVIEPTPVMDTNPVIEPVSTVTPMADVPISPVSQDIGMSSPVIDMPVNPMNMEVVSEPVVNNSVIEPVMPSAPQVDAIPSQPLSSVGPMNMDIPEASPSVDTTPIVDTNVDNPTVDESPFNEQKEAFMQACENMFDALVQKFEKELENRK